MENGPFVVCIDDLKRELEELGIDPYIITEKDWRNLYTAKKIIEEYHFGRELRLEEKRGLIHAVLGSKLLNKGNCGSLDSLAQRLEECGFSKQEAYAIIINLGVNGKIIDKNGFTATNFLSNKKGIFQGIQAVADKVETGVSPFTVIIAASEVLSEEEIQKLNEEIGKELDISGEEFKRKDHRHMYVAKRMVEEYMTEQPLEKGQRIALIDKLLKLNLAINGRKERRRTEKRFERALGCIDSSKENTTESNECNVGNGGNGVENESDDNCLRAKLENELGINREFLEQKSIKNIAAAVEIVEGYCFKKKLEIEEKRALILMLLSSSLFGERMHDALPKMMDKFQQIGFDEEQKKYGIMINLFLEGITSNGLTYQYSDFIGATQKGWNAIEEGKDTISTEVRIGPVTWRKLINRAEKTMKNAVHSRGKGGEQYDTRRNLANMAKEELKVCDNAQGTPQLL